MSKASIRRAVSSSCRMNPRNLAMAGVAAAAMLLAATPARADVTYDTSLISPPGTYYGTGNDNLHWTTSTTTVGGTGVELGLRAGIRYLSDVTPDAGTSIYRVPTGETTYPNKTGAVWGFAFSFNGNTTDGNSPFTFGDVTTTLTVHDVGTGKTISFNPGPAVITDDSTYNTWGFQNSEMLGWFMPSFDEWVADTYDFTLSANTATGASLGSVSMTVIAAPEPGSLALFGTALGLLGLMFGLGRRRRETV